MIILIVLLVLLLVIALYSGIVIRNTTIEDARITNPIHIAVLSDLHSTRFGRNQKTLIRKLKQCQPDLILMPGDIIDDKKPLEGSFELLNQVSTIAPAYYVMGNHEHIDTLISKNEILELMKKNNITVLHDRWIELDCQGNKLVLAGIDDPRQYARVDRDEKEEEKVLEVFQELNERHEYKILLAHRPERIHIYQKVNFDLIVSGHAHGGQVRIPFLVNGLFAPEQGLFPSYAGGTYRHGNLVHVVSRGLCRRWFLPRVFNPCEIANVKLKPKNRD